VCWSALSSYLEIAVLLLLVVSLTITLGQMSTECGERRKRRCVKNWMREFWLLKQLTMLRRNTWVSWTSSLPVSVQIFYQPCHWVHLRWFFCRCLLLAFPLLTACIRCTKTALYFYTKGLHSSARSSVSAECSGIGSVSFYQYSLFTPMEWKANLRVLCVDFFLSFYRYSLFAPFGVKSDSTRPKRPYACPLCRGPRGCFRSECSTSSKRRAWSFRLHPHPLLPNMRLDRPQVPFLKPPVWTVHESKRADKLQYANWLVMLVVGRHVIWREQTWHRELEHFLCMFCVYYYTACRKLPGINYRSINSVHMLQFICSFREVALVLLNVLFIFSAKRTCGDWLVCTWTGFWFVAAGKRYDRRLILEGPVAGRTSSISIGKHLHFLLRFDI